jgi:hypothetical protein
MSISLEAGKSFDFYLIIILRKELLLAIYFQYVTIS